jgi:4-hydroxyacetophenone monooxygenase
MVSPVHPLKRESRSADEPATGEAADAAALNRALAEADTIALGMAVIHATGDLELLERLEALGRLPRRSIPPDLDNRIRLRAAELVTACAGISHPKIDLPVLERMVRLASGYDPVDVHVPMLIEQAGLLCSTEQDGQPTQVKSYDSKPVVVVGAGASGIAAGVALRRAGIPFVIIEKGAAVGGTWHENIYPGCGVDTPSFFYCYSFTKPRWSRYFAKRAEIAAYFEQCVDAFDLGRNIILNTNVERAAYDEGSGHWRVAICGPGGRSEVLEASSVIVAVGQLNRPAVPSFSGMSAFEGPVVHTARWPAGLDLAGKHVVMIGTGASGMQVGPAIAPIVETLTIVQRSPHWVLPNKQYHREISAGERALLDQLPFYANWLRALMIWSHGDAVYPALEHDPTWPEPGRSLNAVSDRYRLAMTRYLQEQLSGRPDLIEKATPPYPPYGKRVLLDNHWFQTLRRENVNLVAQKVQCFAKDGVITDDGVLRQADAVILATGFEASHMLSSLDLRGRNGIRLRDQWGNDDPRAHLGITVPNFPNLFVVYGPNTNLGYGGSAIFHSEAQVAYAVKCIRAMLERKWKSLECRQEVHDAYNDQVDARHAEMVWARSKASNWYKNKAGRVSQNSPWRMLDYWHLVREPNFDDFLIEE